ncbi:MAG TPA: class I SAM-dependent methyltransferase, partial [Terriglobia bacterium]|nr:class I SAM-dependent methyltransferase [Terriglobia bacterium]
SVLRSNPEALWDRSGKVPVFRLPELLRHLPAVPDESLALVFCWHLFDLVPHAAIAELFDRLMRCLQPGGVLFCLVREPYLPAGADNDWWLETLATLGKNGAGKAPFAYPPITNRQMESLAPMGSVKTFLTRAGLREVVVLK